MVINLARHRTAIVLGIVGTIFICIACLLAGSCISAKRVPEKTALPPEKKSCGQFLEWEKVNVLFSKYDRATIIDFETGKSFRVQRRAGSSHADVQPLTAKDTAVMKDIYQGRWSWRRRSVILVLEDGSRVAASMAGMPHGQGAIRGNRFNGHFCLHFRDSKTHGSSKTDLAHQMMVWKAAGILDDQLAMMPAGKVAEAFIAVLNQGDKTIASRLVTAEEASRISHDITAIESVRVKSIKPTADLCFEVSLYLRYQGSSRDTLKQGRILLIPAAQGWLVDYPAARAWLFS